MKNPLRSQTILSCVLFACGLAAALPALAQAPCPTRPPSKPRPTPCSPKLTLEQKDRAHRRRRRHVHPTPCRPSACPASRCPTPRWACAPGDRPRPTPAALPWPPHGIRDFARKLGESLGKDARARGVNFLLGPGVNIARSPVAAATSNTSPKIPSSTPHWWFRTSRACSRRASSPP